jgi:hypothetical protein
MQIPYIPGIGIPFVPFVGYGDEEPKQPNFTGWILLAIGGWVAWQVVREDVFDYVPKRRRG